MPLPTKRLGALDAIVDGGLSEALEDTLPQSSDTVSFLVHVVCGLLCGCRNRSSTAQLRAEDPPWLRRAMHEHIPATSDDRARFNDDML